MTSGSIPSGVAKARSEWYVTITTIRSHFESVLLGGLQQSEPILLAMRCNVAPLDRVWGPMEHELGRAQRALGNDWRRHSARFARDTRVLAEEETRYALEVVELELAFAAAYRQVRARAAQTMLQFALEDDSRSRYCVNCKAPLINTLVGSSQNYSCVRCGFDQVLEPGPAFRSFAIAGARWVGEWDAFPHWQCMRRAKARIGSYRDTRDVPMDLLHYFHTTAQRYWQTCLGVETHLVPEMARHMPAKFDASMKSARKTLRNHWQWRAFEES